MELHNFSRRPGKFFLGFLEKCTDGEWLGIKLHNPQLTHQDAFSSILESVIYYIQERFKGSEVTIAFNVLYLLIGLEKTGTCPVMEKRK